MSLTLRVWTEHAYVRGMLDLSKACEGKKKKTNNDFVRARFLINTKQYFCKNGKALKQCREKIGGLNV